MQASEASELFTISNVIKCIPKEAFKKDNKQASILLLRSVGLYLSSLLIISILPYPLAPLGWFFASLTLTGLFSIAHDCGHDSFFTSSLANTLTGMFCLIPIAYPFEAWKLHHNRHHTNAKNHRKLKAQESKTFFRLVNPIFWPYDITKLILLYFDLSEFAEQEQANARLSVLFTYASIGIFFPLAIMNFGIGAVLNFWFFPWLGFHFWKNSLRLALPSVSLSYPQQNGKFLNQFIPCKDEGIKKELLTEMSHYTFPAWFEMLCNQVNYQIPHYLSDKIPSYRLKLAHEALVQSKWAPKINNYEFGWTLLSDKKNKQSKSSGPVEGYPPEKPIWQRLNMLHVPLFLFTHLGALYGLFSTSFNVYTFNWAIIYYFMTGLGITAGHHRLWAHRAYDASYPVRCVLMLWASGAMEGSIRWWCKDHRIHHRYTDTPVDPYNAKRGFFYSHMGWMLFNEPNKPKAKINIDDLLADPMIRFQHKYYLLLGPFMAFVFPAIVAGLLWGDWRGGFFFAGLLRLNFVHHATFFVNSLAHTLGNTTYADIHTPRDSFITAILTLGEGYHNFHHEFPKDYRNGIRFYHYDPTKWFIRMLAFFGLTYNLHKFPENEVQKGILQMQQKKLNQVSDQIDWGPEVQELPEVSLEEVKKRCEAGERLLIIGNIVHDVSKWSEHHPGGAALIDTFVGKDATNAFNGGVYNHSNAGRNMLQSLRVSKLEDHHHESLHESKYEVEYKLKSL